MLDIEQNKYCWSYYVFIVAMHDLSLIDHISHVPGMQHALLELVCQKLCFSHAKTPILPSILNTSHNQVIARYATFRRKAFMQRSVYRFLLLLVSALLKDLNNNQSVTSRKAKVRVFTHNLVVFVLGHNLLQFERG
jgi:hypothetical protein